MSNQQSIHWLAVGKVSDAASREVVRTGGQVVYVASEPTITLVGITHKANAHPDDLAFYYASQIQIDVHSTGLAVVWVSSDRIINAAFSSLTETELITSSEYEARMMDEPTDVPVTTGIDADAPTYFDGLDPDDLEDHPFWPVSNIRATRGKIAILLDKSITTKNLFHECLCYESRYPTHL